jgi:ADP-heptose:LPS heptosyltransferase
MTDRRSLRRLYLGLRRIVLAPFGRRRVTLPPEDPERLLVIRWDRIGDMVLTTPLLAALRRRFPSARLDVLASPANAPVLRDHPDVDRVVVWTGPPRSLRGSAGRRALAGLRREGYGLVVDPVMDWPLPSARLAARLAPLRIGFGGGGREVFYTLSGPEPDEGAHFLTNNERLLAALGIEAPASAPRLGLPPREPPAALRTLGVQPGGFYPAQRWPFERWVELVAELLRSGGVTSAVLLLGPEDEEAPARAWEAGCPGQPVRRPADAWELARTIRGLDVLLCNNSGPLHLAGALGVPTLSTLGPTDPVRWWPVGPHQVVVRSPDGTIGSIRTEQMRTGWMELVKDLGSVRSEV